MLYRLYPLLHTSCGHCYPPTLPNNGVHLLQLLQFCLHQQASGQWNINAELVRSSNKLLFMPAVLESGSMYIHSGEALQWCSHLVTLCR